MSIPDPAGDEVERLSEGQTDTPIPVQGRPVEQEASILEFLGELPLLIICAIALAWIIKSFIAQPFYIPSQSMEQTLMVGDRVVVSKLNYRFSEPSPGDVVVFDAPESSKMTGEDFIKRIVAGPGDKVEVINGRVYVNGKAKDESYTEPYDPQSDPHKEHPPIVVPKDSYFVMGDNRANSSDSRVFGPINKESIVGKALTIYWPLDRIRLLN